MPTRRNPPPAPAPQRQITPDLVADALAHLPPDLDRETWVRVGMAVKSEYPNAVGFELWDAWSQSGQNYNSTDARDTWHSIKSGGKVTIGTLFGMAKDRGFRFPEPVAAGGAGAGGAPTPEAQAAALAERERLAEEKRRQREAEEAEYRRRADRATREAVNLWAQASERGRSPYLVRKGVQGHGVRYLEDGTLLVPMRNGAGELLNLQRIAPNKPTPEQEAAGLVEKRYLPGGRKTGLWHLLGTLPAPATSPATNPATSAATSGADTPTSASPPPGDDDTHPTPTTAAPGAAGVVLLCEGYATGASLHEATGHPVAVGFDAGNLVHVAEALRALCPAALVLVCADDDQATAARTGKNPGRDKASTAARRAAEAGAPAGVVLPEGLPDGGTDFNDLARHAGPPAVAALVAAAVLAPAIPKPQRKGQTAPSGANAGAADATSTGQPSPPPAAHAAAPATAGAAGGGAAAGAVAGERPHQGDDTSDPEDAPRQRRAKRDPFMLLEDGVYHAARDRDGNDKSPELICAPLRVTARTRADDHNGWGCLLEFNDLDGNAKMWAMPSSLLSGEGAEWAARLRDMGLQMAPGTAARNLVAQYIDTRNPAARVTCTDRVGWHPGGVFVLPMGCVGGAGATATPSDDTPGGAGAGGVGGADAGGAATASPAGDAAELAPRYVFQSEAGMENTFRRAGTLQDWQTRVATLCEGNSRLVFSLGCAFAGPLLRLAGIESGGFHFRGDSSKGKTTSLKVAASVWGRPTYMQRWRTTDNALEATAVQHCDSLLILDEIGQVDGKVVGDCAYLLANEQEKGRNTRGGLNRKRRTWRLLFLSSGEKSLADHMAEAGKRVMAGQEVRMVDIPLDAGVGMGGLEALHGHEGPAALADAVTGAAAKVYGTAGRAWLEWVAERFDTLPARLASLLDTHRAQLVPEAASEQVRRVGTRFALVAAAGELAIEAGVCPWPVGEAAEAARVCFNAWLAARGHMDNGEDAAMVRQVRAFLEKNGDALFTWAHRAMDDHRPNTALRVGFKRQVSLEGDPLRFDAAVDYLEKASGEQWRERTDALVEYLVFPEAFKRDVCKGFDARAVAELLRARGHLKHEKDRLTIKHRLPGMDKAPVYHIKPSIYSDEL